MNVVPALILLTLLQKTVPALPLSPLPSFESNLLASLFDPSTRVSGAVHISRLLPGGDLLLAGALVYPEGYVSHPAFVDAESIARLSESTDSVRTAAFVARATVDGAITWGLRVAPISKKDLITAAVAGSEQIFIAGRTNGLVNSAGETTSPGAFIASISLEGILNQVVVHEAIGDRYAAIDWHEKTPDELILVCVAGKNAAVFSSVENKPSKSGVCATRINRKTLTVSEVKPLSTGEGLVQDKFWSLGASQDGSYLYLAVKRQTVENWVHSYTPTVIAILKTSLALATKPRSLPKDLQNIMIVRSARKGLYVSYVSRTYNQENLVVRKLGKGLEEADWDGEASGSVFEKEIVMDLEYTRSIRSDVVDMFVDETGNVQVLLHTAEVVDSTESDFEEHRKLSNGRPALVVITNQKIVQQILQSVIAEQWKPYSIVVADDKFYVTGADEGEIGSPRNGAPRLLLTAVERSLIASPSPVPTAGPSPVPSPFRSEFFDEPTNALCIGESTTILGRGIVETVEADPRLRLQWHPIQMLRRWIMLQAGDQVAMLCTSWKGESQRENSICATAGHVVRWHGKLVYMREFCDAVGGCEKRKDTPINFKGECGADIAVHEFLTVTMHSSLDETISAEEVAKRECEEMRGFPLRWLVSTM